MTNEELLQQAKDQVADKYGRTDWLHMDEARRYMAITLREYFEAYDAAALLAIQSAREEAVKEGYKQGYRFGWENRGLPSYLHPTLAPDRPITEDEREEIRQEWLESGRDSPESDHLNNG